jgi:glutamyl-tRNA synthetase
MSRVSKSPAVFDVAKLDKTNGRHLRLLSDEDFTEVLLGYLERTGWLAERDANAAALVRRSAPSVKRKIARLDEYEGLAGWLFRPLAISDEAWQVLAADVKHSIQVIGGGLGRLEALPEFTPESVKDVLQDQLHVMGEAARDFLEPQRIAITGQTVSTGIYESLVLLGKDEALNRYRETLARLAEVWTTA